MSEIPNLSRKLHEIEARPAVVVADNVTISDAAVALEKAGSEAVFVRLPGGYSIVTKNDFARMARKNIDPSTSISKAIGEKMLIAGALSDSVTDAVVKMLSNSVKHLPIIAEGRLLSYITINDVAKERDFILGNMCSYNLLERRGQEIEEPMPTGTIQQVENCECAILIFEASDELGRIIDKITGGYGYSHVAIDCCEVEKETGKRLMIEATSHGVERSYQDRYGSRAVERVPLRGVDCKKFCDSVKSKIGQQYDITEAITLGLVDADDKQICSGLAKNGLKDAGSSIIEEIIRRSGSLGKNSVIVYPDGKIFISPNGFAEFFGVPRRGGPAGTELVPDLSRLGSILEKFRCKSQTACYRIEIRAENIQITNITQDAQVPLGCLLITDSAIKNGAAEKIRERVNTDLGQDCPVGCGCLSMPFGPITLAHYREHKKLMFEHITGLYNLCEVEFDIDFDIVAKGFLGICIRSD